MSYLSVKNESKKKVVLFIDSEPSAGGVFQYNRTILEAASSLPVDQYKVTVLYTSKIMEQYIRNHIEKVKVRFKKINKTIIQLLLMIGIPLYLLRILLSRTHPVAKIITDQRPDLCIFPSQESFWGYITDIPSIIAIHDLMHRYESKFKEVSGFGRFNHKEKHFKNICKYAKGIMVDSELGKLHVHNSYTFPLEKKFVLPYIAPPNENKSNLSINYNDKYILPNKYILYPAQFWQHKNHERLIKAVQMLKEEIPDIQLVLVGSNKNGYKKIVKLVKNLDLESVVHFMGFVPRNDLIEFYRRATAMVMPTFFGPTNIPPLEAFAIGCPVAVSNVYGMPEQVGDAALLFDPKDTAEIANVIKRLWMQEELRIQLILKGYKKTRLWGQPEFNKKFRETIECVI